MIFPYYRQETNYTCGAASMRMILEYFGISKKEKDVEKLLKCSPDHGTYFQDLTCVANKFFSDVICKEYANFRDVRKLHDKGYQIILCFLLKKEGCDHYAVVKSITKDRIFFWDPWNGQNNSYNIQYFNTIWKSRKTRPDATSKWFISVKK